MSSTATVTATVGRPRDVVSAFATDPQQVLPLISGFGRFRFLGELDEPGHEEWEAFLDVGTLHIGGAIDIDRTADHHLAWVAVRGTRHTFDLIVEPDGADRSLVTMTMTITLSGLVMSRIAEQFARGIMHRHLDAAIQQLRHHLEWEQG
ncbi:SRPBCC family protein [Nocardioides sp. WS12]|uniref:SRPBCC family protein n=1 Tax=Nocardioides sp. WS12 TaxID=2486272 RepID=UPI0015F90E5C|nr:SRPBCC family protein [Nocardioides sp. WS12]